MRFSVNTYFKSKGMNGFDKFGIFTWSVSLAFFIATIFSHSFVVYLIAVFFLVVSVFRLFSKNTDKRYLEEQRFLKFFYNIKYFFIDTKNFFKRKRFASSKDTSYKYFSCPKCAQKIRVPKGHGKVEISCPKCGEKFIKRT